jgi:flagellar biosynthesis protein FlhB
MKAPKATRAKELETILTLCVALVVLFFLTKKQHAYYLTLSVILGVTGLSSTFLTSKISWAWLKMGELMGAVTGKIILSIVFFGFLFPVALVSRVFSNNRKSLQLEKSKGNSYYFTRNHKFEAKDLKNVW